MAKYACVVVCRPEWTLEALQEAWSVIVEEDFEKGNVESDMRNVDGIIED